MTKRRTAAALALAALVAGCGGGGETKTVTVEQTPAGEASATPAATQAAPGVVVSAPGNVDGERVIFAITELKRSGPTVVVNATVSAPEGSDVNAQISSAFSDGQFEQLESGGGQEEGDVFDGIALVDPEGRKKYLVARDSEGRCVCSNALSSAFASADAPVSLEATLAAPPPEVTQVDVTVPRVKTFTGVPISG